METRLIIHADDVGLSRSVNRATFAAIADGIITSASMMVVAPAFDEAADFARSHPDFDFGIHLTFTSEWNACKWGPAAGPAAPTLTGPAGHFWPDASTFATHASLRDVEIELRAQIETALGVGLRPRHVDTHMFALWNRHDIAETAQRIAAEYEMPFLHPGEWRLRLRSGDIPANSSTRSSIWQVTPSTPEQDWTSAYVGIVRALEPGLNMLLVHLGYDEAELTALTDANPRWGSAWRQRDVCALRSSTFRRALSDRGVVLCDWTSAVGSPLTVSHGEAPQNRR